MPDTKSTAEQLEIGVQASRVRFKPGAELSGRVIHHVDVKVDENLEGDKHVFTMYVKLAYADQDAESAG
jgi:hypothetical protein